jgi:hypothetical protein
VDLERIGTAAALASPAVTLQHFGAEFAIRPHAPLAHHQA